MVQLKCGNNKSNKEHLVSFWNGILKLIFLVSLISNLQLDSYLSYIENDGE